VIWNTSIHPKSNNQSKEGNSDTEAFPWHFHGKSIENIHIEWIQVAIIIIITTIQ
jgi:hypothetical protein